MKSKLFISLSVIALIGMSVGAYATMIKYVEGGTEIPKGDCLEMLCQYGCVEEEGTFTGHCCSNDGVVGNDCEYNECCQSGICTSGKCQSPLCNFGGRTYQNGSSVGECGKCNNGTIEVGSSTAPDCKGTCNTTTWTWNLVTDYTNKDSSGKCCINGVRAYDATNCPAPSECVKNVDWGGSCTDDCQCKDGTGAHSGWSGACINGVCCYQECLFCGSEPYCPGGTEPEDPEGDLPGPGEPCEPTVGCRGELVCGGCEHVCYRPVKCSPKRKEGGAQKKATASRSDVKAAAAAECMSEVAYVKKICAESGSADKWNAWVKDSSCKHGYFGYKNSNAHTEIEWIDGVKCRCGDKHSFDDKYRWLMI